MRPLEELKEKYKDGWWEGHDGYTQDEMCSDIIFLIFAVKEYKESFEKGYVRGRQANVRIGELIKERDSFKDLAERNYRGFERLGSENEGLKREIEKSYRDLDELQQDKVELEKLAFDLGKENEQLRKRNEELFKTISQTRK